MPMNLPNKLTIVRIIMIPFFVFFLLTDFVAGSILAETVEAEHIGKLVSPIKDLTAAWIYSLRDILQESIIL